MPSQGETKWVESDYLTSADLWALMGGVPGSNLTANNILNSASWVVNGFLGIVINGVTALNMYVDTLFSGKRAVLEEITRTLAQSYGYYQAVVIAAEYRYTTKDGGLWVPTHNIKSAMYIRA